MARSLVKTPPLEHSMAAAPILRHVPGSRVRELAAEGTVHRYRKGTYLCHQGDPASDVYFLVQGKIEISSISPAGSRILHASVDIPQFLGELGVFGDLPRTADVLALEDSEIWAVDGERFLRFVTDQPAAARDVLAALARQVHEHQAFVDDLLFLDLKGRVAKRLLQMGTPTLAELPKDGTTVPPVTHADLASLCGGSRENVSRILSDFQRRGLVEREGHRYVLKKVGGLAKIADL
ncbi:MAG TPA: Crp/Fnr family transcriptional regulator [Actinomycetota bacterium]|nr:Crp/Fnr family transcriptional regulator [Actinomycetota bacterium]